MSGWVIALLVVTCVLVLAVLVIGILSPGWARRHEDRAEAQRTAALQPPAPVHVEIPEKVLVAYARNRLLGRPRFQPRSPLAEFRDPEVMAPGRHRLRGGDGGGVVSVPEPRTEAVAVESTGSFSAVSETSSSVSSDTGGSSSSF